MSVHFSTSSAEFSWSSFEGQLVAFFTGNIDSKLAQTQLPFMEQQKSVYNDKAIHAFFVVPTTGNSQSDLIVIDETGDLLHSADFPGKRNNGSYLIFGKVEQGKFVYLIHKENPEPEYDWGQVIADFADNYRNSSANEKNLWKWGQVVQESGDYLCIDCGYITYFEAGTLFPVCEVCLSGEPAGPASSDGAFWEKV